MRDALVMHEVVQKNWPMHEIVRMTAAHFESIACVKMYATPPPPTLRRQYVGELVEPSLYPELLNRSVKT